MGLERGSKLQVLDVQEHLGLLLSECNLIESKEYEAHDSTEVNVDLKSDPIDHVAVNHGLDAFGHIELQRTGNLHQVLVKHQSALSQLCLAFDHHSNVHWESRELNDLLNNAKVDVVCLVCDPLAQEQAKHTKAMGDQQVGPQRIQVWLS